MKHGKKTSSKPPEPLVLSVNTIVCGKFLRAREPIPTELLPEIPQSLINEYRVDPEREPEPTGEVNLVYQANESYLLDAHGFRYNRNVRRQTAQMMAQARADELLRQEEAEKREAIEKEQWYQQKLDDEFALSQAKMRCLEEIDRRRREAEDFLAAERAQQEEQERAATIPTISKGTP